MPPRLRNPFFTYPTDSDSDSDTPLENELDESTQESILSTLATQDAQKTTLYRNAFLILPLTSASYTIYTFLSDSLSPQQRLLSLLGLSSLLCTGYILYFMPITPPERKGKVAVYKFEEARGPVDRYLVVLNGGLAGLLFFVALVKWGRGLREEAWRQALPGIVCGLSMAARQFLAPVDLEELRGARFGYKGA